MADSSSLDVGTVVSLWRYPVKSMMGEELNAAHVTDRGLIGDRVCALYDPTNGKIASAKHPHKWAKLFACHATFIEPPRAGMKTPLVRIVLPNGDVVTSDQPDLNQVLANALGREVTWATSASENASLEEYWPDMEGLAHRETVTDEAMPPGTFFDMAAVHVLTTATMDHLRKQQPGGRFDARRFRPNIVIQPAAPEEGFPEDAWLGPHAGDRRRCGAPNHNTLRPVCDDHAAARRPAHRSQYPAHRGEAQPGARGGLCPGSLRRDGSSRRPDPACIGWSSVVRDDFTLCVIRRTQSGRGHGL